AAGGDRVAVGVAGEADRGAQEAAAGSVEERAVRRAGEVVGFAVAVAIADGGDAAAEELAGRGGVGAERLVLGELREHDVARRRLAQAVFRAHGEGGFAGDAAQPARGVIVRRDRVRARAGRVVVAHLIVGGVGHGRERIFDGA